MQLTQEMKDEYRKMFKEMKIRPEVLQQLNRSIERILEGKNRYLAVEIATKVPWYVVGIIHQMESTCNFKTHLYNGDPLSARTVRHPAGYPKEGNPPFSWEFSAIKALEYEKFTEVKDWNKIETILYCFEKYNGFGYRGKINSPYLWAGTNLYERGRFVEKKQPDGTYKSVFFRNIVSRQLGCAVYLKEMLNRKIIDNIEIS